MAKFEEKTHLVRVRIRPAKLQDFKNSENPSGLSSGMRFLLGTEADGWKTYRINEASSVSGLQDVIDKGRAWVPCSGFESEVNLIKTQKS